MLRRNLALFTGLVAVMAATSLCAQPYPNRPIRLVLNVGTGGVAAMSMVVNASPDGYTLVQAGNAAAISASLFKKPPYDVLKDFAQISTLGIFQLAIVVTPESGFNTLGDLLAYARKNPGKMDIGTINVGSTQYLSAELFKSLAGIKAQTVPFKSNTLLLASLRGNELRVAFELIGPVLAPIRNNQLKALAVGSSKRFGGLPDVPTFTEGGLAGFEDVASWTGISAPARTPAPILERLSREIAKAAALPDVRQTLQDMGIEASASTPAETRKRMAADITRWRKVIDDAKIERQ